MATKILHEKNPKGLKESVLLDNSKTLSPSEISAKTLDVSINKSSDILAISIQELKAAEKDAAMKDIAVSAEDNFVKTLQDGSYFSNDEEVARIEDNKEDTPVVEVHDESPDEKGSSTNSETDMESVLQSIGEIEDKTLSSSPRKSPISIKQENQKESVDGDPGWVSTHKKQIVIIGVLAVIVMCVILKFLKK